MKQSSSFDLMCAPLSLYLWVRSESSTDNAGDERLPTLGSDARGAGWKTHTSSRALTAKLPFVFVNVN